jgi:hypothetical protein
MAVMVIVIFWSVGLGLVILLLARSVRTVQRWRPCPVRATRVRVDSIETAIEGRPLGVAACDVFGPSGRITCSRGCLDRRGEPVERQPSVERA